VEENLLAAFEKIHALGVVHGDIRKENVMVKEDESVWIIDFELSIHEGVTEELIRDNNAALDYMLQILKEAKADKEDQEASIRKSEGESADAVKLVDGLKGIKVGEEAQGEMEIPDIGRTATPVIPGKTPEGTDGEEEDSESSDTDSTW
jgi:serine/threonine-protein kinase RIO1